MWIVSALCADRVLLLPQRLRLLSSRTSSFAACEDLSIIYVLTNTIGCICTHTWRAARLLERSWQRSDISPARFNPSGRVQYYLRSGFRSDLNYSIYDCCPVSRASVWLAALMRRTRPETLKSSLFCWIGILIIRRPAQIAFTSLTKSQKQHKDQGNFMTRSNTTRGNKQPRLWKKGLILSVCINRDANPCLEVVVLSNFTHTQPTLQSGNLSRIM